MGKFITGSQHVWDALKRYGKSGSAKVGHFFRTLDFSRYTPSWLSVRRAQVYALFALCALASWLRSGTDPSLQAPLVIIPFLLLVSCFFLPRDERAQIFEKIKRDPVFRYGGVLLGLIMIQSLNSNYPVVPDETGAMSMVRNPPRLFPWSVNPGESWQLFAWFFPALTGALLVRHFFEWRHIKLLLHLLMWNAGALAFVGIAQHIAGGSSMLGIWNVPGGQFFATFDYANHAAEWFYLNAFIALALLKDSFDKHKPPMQGAVWATILLLCVLSALLTLSRFGAVVALIMLFTGLSLVAKRVFYKVSGAGTTNVVIAVLIVAMLGLVLFLGAGGGSLAREVGDKSMFGEHSVAGDLGGRVVQMPMAFSIFADYPLFGSGGWGYGNLARLYVSADDEIMWDAAGKVNVHCDPLQFLSEFGVVGSAALVLVLFHLIKAAVTGWRKSAMSLWIGVGVGVVAVHSLIDLPFRCPAILILWCVLLAAHPLLSVHSHVKAEISEGPDS